MLEILTNGLIVFGGLCAPIIVVIFLLWLGEYSPKISIILFVLFFIFGLGYAAHLDEQNNKKESLCKN